MIRPKPLKKGDKIALIGTSSPVAEERLKPAIKAIEDLGLEVVLCESATSKHGYLSGKDEIRAKDINNMFKNEDIKGIFVIRGGYGSARLLDMLDYKMIKKNPKVFVGYSDVTALHNVLNEKCNLITFHGPMPSTEFYKGVDSYTMNCFKENIFECDSSRLLTNPSDQEIKTLVEGKAEGRLVGGNLTLVCSSMGTPYEIDTKGKILFLEDIDEYPFRIDRMLVQLKQCGKFKDASGIILGAWTDCTAPDPDKSLSLLEVFEELIVPENKPTIYNIACGHCLPTMTLPLGAKIRINTKKNEIRVLD